MIRVVATFQLKPGALSELLPLAQELVKTTRTEAGCALYTLVQSTKDENKLVMLEAWESKQALDAHSASEHFGRLVPQMAALCAAAPVVETFAELV